MSDKCCTNARNTIIIISSASTRRRSRTSAGAGARDMISRNIRGRQPTASRGENVWRGIFDIDHRDGWGGGDRSEGCAQRRVEGRETTLLSAGHMNDDCTQGVPDQTNASTSVPFNIFEFIVRIYDIGVRLIVDFFR